MFKQVLMSAMLLATPMAVLAQAKSAATPAAKAQAAPALTPEQQAANQKLAASMTQGALQVAQLIDQGKAGEVWDGASTVAKGAVNRSDFIKQVDADRAKVGKLVSRKFAAITSTASKGGATPEGTYINVSFATQFASEKQPIRELVSFHLDGDKTWRVSGYTLR